MIEHDQLVTNVLFQVTVTSLDHFNPHWYVDLKDSKHVTRSEMFVINNLKIPMRLLFVLPIDKLTK
jgi:hypothetical protein